MARSMAYHEKSRSGEIEECPLCRVIPGKSRRAFVKHVGRHLEEIALMALPRDNVEDSDEESTTTEQELNESVVVEVVNSAIEYGQGKTRCICGMQFQATLTQ